MIAIRGGCLRQVAAASNLFTIGALFYRVRMHRSWLMVIALASACQDESRHVCGTVVDCPGDPTCTQITCEGHICKYSDVPDRASSPLNQPGDCKLIVCDGMGGFTVQVDPNDLPATTASCQIAACSADGTPSVGPAQTDTPCGSGMFCSDVGTCVACNGPLQCPGTDTACQARTCVNNACGITYTASGTSCGSGKHCDGAGNCA